MDISLVVKIASKAWALTILSLMHKGLPGRQAPLLAASGAGRTAFAQSLAHLIDLGLIARNPGHGHPLRPEFLLTPQGEMAAALASRVLKDAGRAEMALIRKSWTVPVLGTLAKPRHFSEIGTRLPPITDRALSQSLQAMEQNAWVLREVDGSARPPRPVYRAINRGADISQSIADCLAAG